ncbi:MAG TPA: potassium channel family protein [Bradyrhizobium sp.]|jgi:hypothetical protein|nr:potassium channel family protein [Bradyrhizobium sp.]
MSEFSANRRLLALIDDTTLWHLAAAAFFLTLLPAAAYCGLGNWKNGFLGSIGFSGTNGEWQVDTNFWDALYFSIVTEATLGYGDIAPKGLCRGIAATQVLFGILLGGFAVGKVSSAPGQEIRRLRRLAEGHWIETLHDE